jgi:predicted transposase/invertase (TIGR01784 family)
MLEQASSAKTYQPALRVYTIVVLTSGNKYSSAMATIKFDPFDLVTQQYLGEIEHKVLYLSPKHLSEQIPQPYHEWLRAIKDSLDEQVEESEYQHPSVLKIFELIQREGLTPQDRARMKDEFAWEAVKQDEYQKGVAQGLAQGEAQGIAKGLAEGEKKMQVSLAKKLLQLGQLDLPTIAKTTGLTTAELEKLGRETA